MSIDVTEETVTEVPVEGLSNQSNETASQNSESWQDALSEDLRGNANLEKYTSVDSLAKGYINATSMLGKDKVLKPSNEDEWNEFYKEMGRPEDASGYEFNSFDAPEGYEIDEGLVQNFRNAAHGAGLSSEQAKTLYDWYTSNNVEQFDQMVQNTEQQLTDTEQAMRKEWGNAYDQKMGTAIRAVREFGGDELVEELNASGLGNNPKLIKAFALAGEKISGDTQLAGTTAGAMTPAQVKEQIASIQNDPKFYDTENLERPAMVRKMQNLMEELHGTTQTQSISIG
jgi:hypothetical protein|tara:strand:+ start:1561 stop:2415 length:855 start_codon:yes stop_codon:yes gene_type:complete